MCQPPPLRPTFSNKGMMLNGRIESVILQDDIKLLKVK